MDCIVQGIPKSQTQLCDFHFLSLHHLSLSSPSTPVTALFSALGHGLPCSVFWGSLQGFPYSFQDSIWVLGELDVLLVSWRPTAVSLGFGPCPKRVHWCGMDSCSLVPETTQLFLDVLWASGGLLLQMREGFAVLSGHMVSAWGGGSLFHLQALSGSWVLSVAPHPHAPWETRPKLLFCSLHTQPDGVGTCEAVLIALALPLGMAPPVYTHGRACPAERAFWEFIVFLEHGFQTFFKEQTWSGSALNYLFLDRYIIEEINFLFCLHCCCILALYCTKEDG